MNDSHSSVVLHRSGDQAPITINEDKCLIRTVHNNQQIDCCAIFNGPNGSALRSYTDNVLVNGEPTSAQWLTTGDEIQLPCSTRIRVKAASAVRPVSTPRRDRDVAAVEKQLAEMMRPSRPTPATQPEPVVDSTSENASEEVFHSPFSFQEPDAIEKSSANPTPTQGVAATIRPAAEASASTEPPASAISQPSQPTIAESEPEERFPTMESLKGIASPEPAPHPTPQLSPAPQPVSAPQHELQQSVEMLTPADVVQPVELPQPMPTPPAVMTPTQYELPQTPVAVPQAEQTPQPTEIPQPVAALPPEPTPLTAPAVPADPTPSPEAFVATQALQMFETPVVPETTNLPTPIQPPAQPEPSPAADAEPLHVSAPQPTQFLPPAVEPSQPPVVEPSPPRETASTVPPITEPVSNHSDSSPSENLESVFARLGLSANPNEVPATPTPAAASIAVDTPSVPTPVVESTSATQPQQPSASYQPAPTMVQESIQPQAAPAPVEDVLAQVRQPASQSQATPAFDVPPAPAPVPAAPSAPDSLSELPADLRSQLNDLVSSLEQESESFQATPAPAVPTPQPIEPQLNQMPIQPPAQPALAEPAMPPAVDSTPTPPGSGLTSEAIAAATQSIFSNPVPAEDPPRVDASVSAQPPMPVEAPMPTPTPMQPEVAQPLEAPMPAEPAVATEPMVAAQAPEQPEPTPEPPKPVAASSVAEILGNLGMSIPADDEPASPMGAAETSFQNEVPNSQPEPTPTPAQPPVEEVAPEAAEAPKSNEAEDDVQAYMDRLLNRTAEDKAAEEAARAAAEAEAARNQRPVVTEVLSEEEFVPSQKASRPEDFDTLREIANSSSRNAVRASTLRAHTESIIVKSSLVGLSFIGAVGCWGMGMTIPTIAFVGALCATSYLFYQDHTRRKKTGGGKSR